MASSDTFVNYKRDHAGKLVASRKHVLHPPDCENSEKDIALMQLKLQEDPDCLQRESDQYVLGEYLRPLGQAIYRGHEKCVEFLINPGGDIKNYSKQSIRNIIYCAIEFDRKDILEYFLTHKLYRSLAEPELDTSYLHYAVREDGDVITMIDILFKLGVPVENFNNFDIRLEEYSASCPAAAAILRAQPYTLKHLLLHGAVVDHRQTGRTDLSPEVKDCLSLIHHYAVAAAFKISNNSDILTMLHEFGANLWERNRHGLTPLEVMQNKEFLEREVNARDELYETMYCECGDYDRLVKMTGKMSELMVQPLKLTSWCRVSLVRSMGVKYLENIDKLTPQDLPVHIKDFLRGDDLKASWF